MSESSPLPRAALDARALAALHDYACWANRRLFEAVARLTPEEFTRSVAGGHASVRDALVHVLSAEWGWLERCGGPARGARLEPRDYPTAASLAQVWARVEAHAREFLARLDDDDLARVAVYRGEQGEERALPVGELLSHAALHGIHHRGQVALLVRMLGHAPGGFDFLLYSADQRGVPAF